MSAKGESDYLPAAQRIVAGIFGPAAERSFDVRYWSGIVERGAARAPRFTLVVARPGALRRMLLPPTELSIVEAFISGDVDIDGDLEAAIELGDAIGARIKDPRTMAALIGALLKLPSTEAGDLREARFHRPGDPVSGRRGGAAAIRHHYDVGNDFYELWLDREMVYTCGYFRTGKETLDEAQLDKMDHICRKLRLRQGERLLDIGCGWGGLLRYAASRYGAIAHGITLSAAQAEYARARIAREGLSDRCRVEVLDYRDLEETPVYDKAVSVGMMEHVAPEDQPAYFAAALGVLKPGGLFLNHTNVTLQRARPRTPMKRLADRLWRRGEFISRYVFPDGELVPAAHMIASAERVGFELRDVESLREHYAITLRHWLRGLESNAARARQLVGERTYRVWRLYMSSAAQGFATARINIIQALLSKPDERGRAALPPTREDWYRSPYPSEQQKVSLRTSA